MDFGANETPVKIIKESAFEETYFRDIYYIYLFIYIIKVLGK